MNFRRSVIVAKLWRQSQDVKILWEIFGIFLEKTTPYGKFFEILFRKFSPPHHSRLLGSNFVKFGRREIGEIVRYLPKICQGQSPTMYPRCSRFHPYRFTFGGVIAESMYTAKSRPKVNLMFGRSLASSQILMPVITYKMYIKSSKCY